MTKFVGKTILAMKKSLLSLLSMLLAVGAFAFPSAQVDTLSIDTRKISPSPVKVTVAVPESYLAEGDTASYPVVYLLNGYSGDYRDYAANMHLDNLATLHNVIIVCPDGRDSWYWDSPVDKGMQMESFIVDELVPAIDAELRTRADRDNRAIAGLSMGGHGALWLAIRHSDIWGNAGSMSGGVDITPAKFHKRWKMAKRLGPYASNPSRWREHTVMSLVSKLEPGRLDIIIMCGESDIFINENNEFDRKLTEHGINHQYITAPGDHSWGYWKSALPVILEFFSRSFDR